MIPTKHLVHQCDQFAQAEPFILLEIAHVNKAMPTSKGAGPDGYTGSFYKSFTSAPILEITFNVISSDYPFMNQ